MNTRALAAISLLACAFAGFSHATPASPVLYGSVWNSSSNTSRLVVIDPVTGVTTPVGPLWNGLTAGLGTYNNGLFAFEQGTTRLHQINPANGASLSSVSGPGVFEGGLDIRSDGMAFLASTSSSLFAFPVIGGAPTSLSHGGITLDGLAFDGSDVLYAISQSQSSPADLYTVNQTSGALTLQGTTGLNVDIVAGLAFRSDGTLFYGAGNQLYTLALNGTPTFLANISGLSAGEKVSGLTFLDSSVPEPQTVSMMAAALGVLAWRMRRRK